MIKDINLNSLAANKDKIINALIILVTIFIAINLLKLQKKNIEALNIQKDIEIRKNEVLGKIIQSEKRIISYNELLNRKDASLAMNTISNIAKDCGINIVSIKSEKKQEFAVYIKHYFSLNINTDTYNAIAKFINTLENSPDIYFVDKIDIRTFFVQETEALQAGLILSTVTFKN